MPKAPDRKVSIAVKAPMQLGYIIRLFCEIKTLLKDDRIPEAIPENRLYYPLSCDSVFVFLRKFFNEGWCSDGECSQGNYTCLEIRSKLLKLACQQSYQAIPAAELRIAGMLGLNYISNGSYVQGHLDIRKPCRPATWCSFAPHGTKQ